MTATSANIVEIHHLTKTFHANGRTVTALKDVTLNIEQSGFISIIGPSGCGKSTLLRIIGGLDSIWDGQVSMNGSPINGPGRDKGFVFQDHRLLPWLSVRNNIRFALNGNQRKQDALIQENIDLVGLTGFEDSLPKQLSGGMAQRVAIARALVNRPQILLLDEPFAALDPITRMKLQDQLLHIWHTERITMVIVTHDIDEAVYLGQKVVVMKTNPGEIVRVEQLELPDPRPRTGERFNRARDSIMTEFIASS